MLKYVRGQVWWCKNTYDVNTGERDTVGLDGQKLFNHIQQGMRPVLIISNDTGNKFSETLQVIPCTSADKNSIPTHCSFYINRTKNTFLCEQIKTINKSDLTTYLTTLEEREMAEIEKCSQIALGIIRPTKIEKISLELDENKEDTIIINKEENDGSTN